ncbi:uncharacterized protein MELLADRAFT_118401 [Melampsora larici-populina 98AG31]|uniref:CRAL/TRIO N-terminal domain-containing protein n=1 Tax=Melampsora larici-populina (strain 98AG31 / pathotype 3-4-7) TaxID=747676 RepID=F4S8S4_MELLP|nr:uncharacterized protein MELLADRAFT_118401 [Melampsora larici-populina 98AG31]EGF98946.1 hypothetical protein MELLADRAFT_118401 [Melampsora larici-populina 98AG31]
MNEENQLKHQKLPFLSSLKHPAQSATLPPKPSELNQAQSEIYQNVLNHLSTPNYQLPITLNQLRQKDTQSLLPLSDIERCYCSREFILRTCRATRWNQTACINRIEETLVWRREYGVDELDIDMISKEDHETYFPLLIELAAQRRKQMLARYHRLGPNSIGLSEYELRGGKTETSVEDDDTSTSSPEIETAEPILRRPRFRHHAETDAADSVHSDRPPSGSQKSGIEGTEPTSNDYELPSIQESSTAPEPTSSTSPTSPNLKPATKSVSHAQPSTEPIIEAPIPTNRPDSQAIELKSNEESETPSKANSSKFSQKIGFMKNSLAFHFKQHQEEEKEKKRTKKENKAIANGLQVKADELGRPLTDQVGASRRLSRILAK